MKKILCALLSMVILLAGCNMPLSPTSVPDTATPAPRPSATELPPLATPTLALPVATPISTTGNPPARIVLFEPGISSKIVSPVMVRGESDPTFEQGLGITVTDENGAVIGQTHTIIAAEIGMRGPFEASLPFAVDHDQQGRISVFDVSARDGGLIYLTSVWVTLLSSGGAEILPSQGNLPFFRIDQPSLIDEISGGTLHVEGLSGPAFENGILVTLCGEGGIGEHDLICGTADNMLLTVPVTIQSPDIGQPGTFSVDLPYSVSQRIPARVSVYTVSPMDGSVIELNSVEIYLAP